MKFDEVLTVVDAQVLPDYPTIKALIMRDEKGHEVYFEYPEGVVKVEINKDMKVRLCIDNVKDENYKQNWDVYMWGKVYYVAEKLVRISLGGLILEIKGYSEPVNIGEKVYVGIKRIQQ